MIWRPRGERSARRTCASATADTPGVTPGIVRCHKPPSALARRAPAVMGMSSIRANAA
jgi:hypothetical protein